MGGSKFGTPTEYNAVLTEYNAPNTLETVYSPCMPKNPPLNVALLYDSSHDMY